MAVSYTHLDVYKRQPYTVGNALTKGGATVKLSALVMGLANMAHKQIIKGDVYKRQLCYSVASAEDSGGTCCNKI